MEEPAQNEKSHNHAAKILVVDDDPDVRSFLSESLLSLGYRSVAKADGPAALAELNQINPDAMILDFAMPGMNGAEVARKARQFRPGLPIILASGYAETAAVKAVMSQPCQLLNKPF